MCVRARIFRFKSIVRAHSHNHRRRRTTKGEVIRARERAHEYHHYFELVVSHIKNTHTQTQFRLSRIANNLSQYAKHTHVHMVHNIAQVTCTHSHHIIIVVCIVSVRRCRRRSSASLRWHRCCCCLLLRKINTNNSNTTQHTLIVHGEILLSTKKTRAQRAFCLLPSLHIFCWGAVGGEYSLCAAS